MAHVKFFIRSKKNPVTIYVRAKLSGGKDLTKSTRKYILHENWNKKKGYPKSNKPECNELTRDLQDLESYILDRLNKITSYESNWLTETIEQYYNKDSQGKLEYFNNYAIDFCDKLKYRSGDEEVSLSSLRKYQNVKNKILSFDKKGIYKIEDVDLNYRSNFIQHLKQVDKLSDNTIGRLIKFTKTFLLDAKKNGYKVSDQIENFKGFTASYEKITLSFEEIDTILNHQYNDDDLQASAYWLVIGCYTGQRVSDLLRMDESMIIEMSGKRFISLKQQKTGKLVNIPIHNKVEGIIKNGFPKKFGNKISSQSVEFNELIKKVGFINGLDELKYGGLFSKTEGKFVYKEYPKYKLITSHICRRSFATNFYGKIPTPILMAITAHGTEKSFLQYIHKANNELSIMLADNDFWNK